MTRPTSTCAYTLTKKHYINENEFLYESRIETAPVTSHLMKTRLEDFGSNLERASVSTVKEAARSRTRKIYKSIIEVF